MRRSLSHLKYLPWRSLVQVSLITIGVIASLEVGLIWLASQSPLVRQLFQILYTPPLGLFVSFAIAFAVGALAVLLQERLKHTGITSGSLWALVLCLAIALVLKQLLPLPPILLSLNYPQFIGMVLGVFWKGRPYWRW